VQRLLNPCPINWTGDSRSMNFGMLMRLYIHNTGNKRGKSELPEALGGAQKVLLSCQNCKSCNGFEGRQRIFYNIGDAVRVQT